MLAALAFGSVTCFAARPYQPVFGDPLLELWRWSAFPELTGLDAQCMTETADGTIWFGTANGLWSYNGIEWSRQSGNGIVGRIVTGLCSQSNGDLYVAGGWGVSQFSNGKWSRLLTTSGSRIIGIKDIPIKELAAGQDGSLWVATSWGALHWAQSTWTLYTDPDTAARLRKDQSLPSLAIELLPEAVIARFRPGSNRCDFTEICADRQGRIWFGTAGGEVLCYASPPANASRTATQGAWSIYDEVDGLGSGEVTSILPLQDGTMWVVHAASEQANVFDGRTWQTVRLPLFLPVLDQGDVGGKLLQTRDGVVWLSARYMLFAYRNGQWQKYEQPAVPFPSTRNVVMQTRDGALWFAGPNTEIHRVDYQTPRWLTLQDLNFQWESLAGAQWFLHRDGRCVVHEGDRWTSYGVEDGLMDTPVALLGTRSGEVWAAGSHEQTAATARFDGRKWTRDLHPDFSFAVDWRAVFESSDGSLWFGAFVDTDGPANHRDGILQFRNGVWIHHHQPGRSPRADGAENPATLLPPSTNRDRPIEKFICLGESRGGKIWAGRSILAFYDGKKWEEFFPAPKIRVNVEAMLTTQEGDLWIGTRESGALRYDGKEWQQFQGKDSLVANSVRSLAQTADGSIWAVTDRGSSRFDGRAWMPDVLPEELNIPHEGGDLKASPSGQLWINRFTLYWMRRAWSKSPPPDPNAEFRTVRHQFQGTPPRTSITSGAEVVSHPGNISVVWSGVVPWREPKDAKLQFSFRLDQQPWSAFTSDRGHSFFTVPAGRHHLEVRARDPEFNVDPTPAILDFVVLPPVWRQSWFILLMILLGGLIATQSIRVLLERGHLRQANRNLALEIEERERTQEALRQSEARLSFALETNNIGAWDLNLQDHTAHRTLTHDRIFGYTTLVPEWTYETFLEHVLPADRTEVARKFGEAVAIRSDWNFECRIRRADGEVRWIWATGNCGLRADDQSPVMSGLVHDITERKRTEEEIRQLNVDLDLRVKQRTAELEAANRELEAFSYSVSHDLRAPLRSIDGFSKVLLEDYAAKLDEEGKDNLQRVRAAAQRMGQLIEDMLNLARVTRIELRMVSVDLSQLVWEIAGELARHEPARKVDLTVAADAVVAGDGHLLRIALENLLGNAWKFTARREDAKIEFGTTEEDGQRVYFVRDNGAGFDMADASKLFGEFQRLHSITDFPGTGVGLAIVQRVIRRHAGRVWAEAKVDGGATFFFTLGKRF